MPIPASTSDRGPMDPRLIRNFCIIAHIDHGKTTLSDRILELTGALSKREMSDQVLDGMDLERERGITIKAHAVLCSAKEGTGVREILEAVVREVPSPKGDPEGPPKALVFDSWFDAYRGVVILVRVIDGTLRRKMRIRLMATGRDYDLEDLGLLTPKLVPVDSLSVGEVGFLIANIRNSAAVKIGATVTDSRNPAAKAFPGFQEMRPMVFAGLFPIGESSYDNLRDALDKLRLNDSSFTCEPETSEALGFGFRCGFLGLLHMEIVQQRLERHFGLDLITTAPSVRY